MSTYVNGKLFASLPDKYIDNLRKEEHPDGINILHGHLKTVMADLEDRLSKTRDTDLSVYINGLLDAYGEVYTFTYDWAFFLQDKMSYPSATIK